MKRVFILIFLLFAFVCSFLLFTPRTVQAFIDVPHDYVYADEISALYNRNIINGYSDFSFHPYGLLPRVEALSMILKARGDEIERMNDLTFSDVHSSDWYFDTVNYSYNNGIINGHPDGSFHPTEYMNWAEAAKIVTETFYPGANERDFRPDVLIYSQYSDWFAPFFAVAKQQNIVSRKKFYYPDQKITRGELASMIYRILLIQENKSQFIPALDNKVSNEFMMYIPKLGIHGVPVVNIPDLNNKRMLIDKLIEGLGNLINQPGSSGNTVIYGHSSWYPGRDHPYKHILRQIDQLGPGDRIYINYGNQGYVYEVTGAQIVSPRRIEILNSNGHEELTIFTCWPPDSIKYRYVVNAAPVSTR